MLRVTRLSWPPHRLFLPAPTLWRVCLPTAPSPPHTAAPARMAPVPAQTCPWALALDFTGRPCPCASSWRSLPQTTHPCPHDCPRHSCQKRPGATLPSVRGTASPVHTTLCPQWPGSPSLLLHARRPVWRMGSTPQAWRQASRYVCSWSQTWFCFLLKNGNLGHRQLKGDPGPQSEILLSPCLPGPGFSWASLTSRHIAGPSEVTQAHFLWEAGGAVEQGLLLGGDWRGTWNCGLGVGLL